MDIKDPLNETCKHFSKLRLKHVKKTESQFTV